jgi:hypothetical protein
MSARTAGFVTEINILAEKAPSQPHGDRASYLPDGRSASLGTMVIHADSQNYRIVEEVFQSMAHVIAQYLHQTWMKPENIAGSKF